MDGYRQFLAKTLEILEFSGDMGKWIEEFLQNAQKETYVDLILTLPEEQQETLQKQLSSPPFGKTHEYILKEYFSPLDISITLQENIIESYKQFVQNVINMLPPDKQKQLQDFLMPLINTTAK